MTEMQRFGLTASQLLAATTEVLLRGGYREAEVPTGYNTVSRLFEDLYGVIGVCAFDTWADLRDSWHLGQGELVDAISSHISRGEPKAWEGYLVLLAAGPVPLDERPVMSELRYDTNRVRKIVSTGSDIFSVSDVEAALLPLLPLEPELAGRSEVGVLERLPEILFQFGVRRDVAIGAVAAFVSNESIVERLHAIEVQS